MEESSLEEQRIQHLSLHIRLKNMIIEIGIIFIEYLVLNIYFEPHFSQNVELPF